MSKSIESGILVGRPFGGVVTLIRNNLRNLTSTIYCTDRYAIVKINNYISLLVCICLVLALRIVCYPVKAFLMTFGRGESNMIIVML